MPVPQSYDPLPGSLERSGSDASTLLQRTKSGDSRQSVRRLPHEPGTQPESFHEDTPKDPSSFNEHETPSQGTVETSSLLSKSSGSYPGDITYDEDEGKRSMDHDSHNVDIRGLAMLSHMSFYLLWSLLGLLTGVGLMTINNIGSDVSSPIFIFHFDDPSYMVYRPERYGITTTIVLLRNSYKNDS